MPKKQSALSKSRMCLGCIALAMLLGYNLDGLTTSKVVGCLADTTGPAGLSPLSPSIVH